MMSATQTNAEQLETGSDLERIRPTVCQCTNVCNRAVGRGSCPCLKNHQLCSRFCKCGTTKMGCKNKHNDTELELPVEVDVTSQQDQMRREEQIQKKAYLRRERRGRKRKTDSIQKSRKGTRKNIFEMWPWLSVSNSGENAFCCICECDIGIDRAQESLLEHSQCKKHIQQAKHWPITEAAEEENQGLYLDCVLEDLPQFKPWLRVNKITGGTYCLYCRSEICKSLEELDRHKASQRHLTCSQMTQSERKEAQGSVNAFLEEEDKIVRKKSEILPSQGESPSAHAKQGMVLLEERRQADEDHPDRERVLSDDVINKHVKATEAQVVSFIVENRLPLEVTNDLVKMLKRLPAAGKVIEKLYLGEEFALNMIRQTTDVHLNVFLVDSLKTNLFSLVVDCQTNESGVTYLGIFALFCNNKFEIQVILFDLVELGEESAEAIFNRLRDSLQTKEGEGILLGNWISFLCNTTNIPFYLMVPLMDMVKQQYPWVMPVVSPGHMAEISAVGATKHLPARIEQACQMIHDHFHSGPVHAASFLKYSTLIAARENRILADQNLPRMASFQYLSNLLEQWTMLTIYFTNTDASQLESDSASILEFLKNPLMKLYVVVLRFLSGLVADHHTKVSKEEPLFQNINDYTNELVRTFANFFMIRERVMGLEDTNKLDATDEESYLPLPQIYLGFEGSSALAAFMEQGQLTFEDPHVSEFLLTVREVYKEFIQHLQISLQFCQPLWQLGRVINPQNLVTTQSAAYCAGDVFGPFMTSDLVDVKGLEQELQVIQGLTLPDLDRPLLWWSQFLNSSTGLYQNIKRVVLFFFSLPVSISSCSQIFEHLKEWNVDAVLKLQTANTGDFLKENVFIKELFEGHCLKNFRKEAMT